MTRVAPLLLAAGLGPAACAALAQQCSIEYQRADNMLAAAGRPDGSLGKETLTLQPGEKKVFITDWKYEKQRNDGRNYYGSHLRIVANTGQRPVEVTLKGGPGAVYGGLAARVGGSGIVGAMKPGQTVSNVRADLLEVSCPPADKEAAPRESGTTPGGTANAALTPPPGGLQARQVSPDQVVLTWQPVPNAKEYRVYVTPPGGRPGVIGGNGNRWVVPIPRNLSSPMVVTASIEAVGANGTISPRAQFNTVTVAPSGASGGPQAGGGAATSGPGSSPTSPSTSAAQQCPPGQFVTGITSSGALICSPR